MRFPTDTPGESARNLMIVREGMVERLAGQARRFAESGAAPAVPRVAATVPLLRPAGRRFEVYLVRRSASLAFASGMYAFPGGSVDPVDHDGVPVGDGWATRLGRGEPDARAVLRAAVREVAEETGVRLDPRDLVPWARWVTPEFEPRRYDTYFFLAALPDGQRPAEAAGEADLAVWTDPAMAVARWQAGEWAMLPPTVAVLRDLSRYDSLPAALAAGRDLATAILPRIADDPDGAARLVLEGGTPDRDIQIGS